jgi:transcriptional regulator with XRE-family HTH domain/tetratricopeptide (TPR) repeat protein
VPNYTNEHSQRFGALLRRGRLSQEDLAREMSTLLRWRIHPTYISRWLHGKKEFDLEEKLAMVQVLSGKGCLSKLEDRLWLGEILALNEAQMGSLVPLSQPILTNLPPPDDLPYLIPESYTALKAELEPESISQDEDEHHLARFRVLHGPPGSGKTALLHHLVADNTIRRNFPVILYADLAADVGVSAALQRWPICLDETPTDVEQAREILRHRLSGKKLLLLLDDLPQAALLPELLVGGEGSRIVLTCTRDIAAEIGIPAEAIIPHRGWDSATAGRYLEALWGRALTAREQSLACELNELVDGSPLSWTVLIPSLHDERSWRDLRDEIAAVPLEALNWPHERQRASLLAAYRRLPPPAQLLFRALGVFAPGALFRAEAAAAVLDRPPAGVRRALHTLDQAAFLRASPLPLSGAHRQMHRLLHYLAHELVDDDPQREACAGRHARFYAESTRPIRQEQNNPGWPTAVGELLPDLPNVRHGQAWAAAHSHPLTVEYFLNLSPYQVAIRDLARDRAWGQAALPIVEANPESLSALDRLTFYAEVPTTDLDQQRAYLERALAIAQEEMGDESTSYQVYGLCWLARFLYDEAGKAMEAEPLLTEALDLAAGSGYPDLETHVLDEAARFFLLLRDRAGLQAAADRLPVEPPAMHAAGLSGNYYHILRAETLRQVGRWREAEETYSQILALYEAIHDRRHRAVFRLRRALCRVHLGDAEGTEADLSWVRERLAELPWAVQVRYQLTLGELALFTGDGEGALAALDALPEGWEEDAELAADAWLLWRQVPQAQGQAAKAREAENQARAIAQAKGFSLRLEEAGRDPVPAEPSLAPALLARIVGGRPPLR